MPYIGNIVQDFSVNNAMLNTDSVTSIKIDDGTIVNADISDSAAIAGTKISPDFGSQNVTTTGNLGGKNLNLLHTAPTISLTDSNADDDFQIKVDGGLFKIIDATNTADRLAIDSSGKVGIGTASPSETLDVEGTIECLNELRSKTGNDLKLNAGSANRDIFLQVNDSTLMTVQGSTERVGIGTTSPDAMLHLSGTSPFIRFTDTVDSSHYAHIGHADTSVFVLDADAANAHAGSGIEFKVDNSSVMFLKNGGNVGIGTTSPSNKLVVNSAAHDDGIFLLAANNNQSTNLKIQAKASNGTEHNWNLGVARSVDRLGIDNGTTTHFCILDGGNVGIGTISPTAKLEVVGGTGVNVLLNAATHDATTANQARLQLGYVHSGGQALGHIKVDEGGNNSFDGILRLGVPYNNQSGGSSTREVMEADFNGNICFPGSTTVFDTTARTNGLQLYYETDSGIATIASYSAGGNTRLDLGTNSGGGAVGIGMTIRESGVIGIGTTSPEGVGLDITKSRTNAYGATSDNRNLAHLIARNGSDAAGRFASISMISGGGTQAEGSLNLVQTGDYAGDLTFKLRSAVSTWAERMRIKSDGKISIGGNAKAKKLTIVDDNASQAGANDGTITDALVMLYGGKRTVVNSETTIDETILHLKGQITDSGTSSTGEHTTNKIVFSGRRATGAQCWIEQTVNWHYGNQTAGGNLVFSTAPVSTNGGTAPVQRMVIHNDGTVVVNDTGDVGGGEGGVRLKNPDVGTCRFGASNAGNLTYIQFINGSSITGSISGGSSATSFNTTSDYRLKENESLISDGIARLKQLKPYRFNWKSDSSTIVDGFFAHEVSSIVPESITGTKDAVAVEDDVEKGLADAVGDPIYQSIDQAKLVPLLTAALQEAVAEIETLKTKVAALEAA